MTNAFTVGVAQSIAGLPLFRDSAKERPVCLSVDRQYSLCHVACLQGKKESAVQLRV